MLVLVCHRFTGCARRPSSPPSATSRFAPLPLVDKLCLSVQHGLTCSLSVRMRTAWGTRAARRARSPPQRGAAYPHAPLRSFRSAPRPAANLGCEPAANASASSHKPPVGPVAASSSATRFDGGIAWIHFWTGSGASSSVGCVALQRPDMDPPARPRRRGRQRRSPSAAAWCADPESRPDRSRSAEPSWSSSGSGAAHVRRGSGHRCANSSLLLSGSQQVDACGA